jgi:hypothetical protein
MLVGEEVYWVLDEGFTNHRKDRGFSWTTHGTHGGDLENSIRHLGFTTCEASSGNNASGLWWWETTDLVRSGSIRQITSLPTLPNHNRLDSMTMSYEEPANWRKVCIGFMRSRLTGLGLHGHLREDLTEKCRNRISRPLVWVSWSWLVGNACKGVF